jgi:hypothetical protein
VPTTDGSKRPATTTEVIDKRGAPIDGEVHTGDLTPSGLDEVMSNVRASVDVRVFDSVNPITAFHGADGYLLPEMTEIKAPLPKRRLLDFLRM